MNTLKNIVKFQNRKILLCVLLHFQFSIVNATVLKEDSLKSEYDIKDPRNPNCPCHKFQKLADEEYKKLLGKEIKLNPIKTESNYTNAFSGNNEVNSKTNIGAKRFRSRNKTWNFFEHKKKKTSKQKKVKRFRKDNATCFHF